MKALVVGSSGDLSIHLRLVSATVVDHAPGEADDSDGGISPQELAKVFTLLLSTAEGVSMTIRDLVVHLDPTKTGQARMDYAFGLAEAHKAHVLGVGYSPLGIDKLRGRRGRR